MRRTLRDVRSFVVLLAPSAVLPIVFSTLVLAAWSAVLSATFATALVHSSSAEEPRTAVFDLVVRGGRVIDPASGLDAIRDVGLRAGRIVAVDPGPLAGTHVIDAQGLVVAPGFIDLHTHSPTPMGQRYQILDGVTTALELEGGAYPIEEFGEALQDGARIHYGASAGWASARLETKLGIRQTHILVSEPRVIGLKGAWTAIRSIFGTPDDVFVEAADADERDQMQSMLEQALDAGALGIGVPLDYFNEAVDEDELRMIFSVAAKRETLVYIHIRRGINGDPAGLREALRMARETGAALHVCHIQHNAMRNTDLFLEEMREARSSGVDVSTESLPYNAGSALISSAVFGRDWQTIFDIDYGDVEWAATGMRFDEESWNDYRERFPGGQVVHHYVREEWTRRALIEPGVIVVSDLLPMIDESNKVAPHNGAFSRVLGRYVREAGILSLKTALAKMTSMPAQRMEAFFPAFGRKGRVQTGADADLTIFDPEEILDRATYGDPFQPSAGIHTVIVDGQIAVSEGQLVEEVFAGRRIENLEQTE
jgi:N-acyl-D-aspartate/D-glutamate deacylase